MAVMHVKTDGFRRRLKPLTNLLHPFETGKKGSEVLRLANGADRWDGFLEQMDEMVVSVPNELRNLCQIVRTGNRKNVESN